MVAELVVIRHRVGAMRHLSTSATGPLWRTAMTIPLSPETCLTMADVRAGVDATDAELVALLARRFGYMRAAARIKPDRGAVRDETRKAQVIANVRLHAVAADLPPERLAAVWEALVEQSIAYELEVWDATR
jgi:isochorismate pyruvate lyase